MRWIAALVLVVTVGACGGGRTPHHPTADERRRADLLARAACDDFSYYLHTVQAHAPRAESANIAAMGAGAAARLVPGYMTLAVGLQDVNLNGFSFGMYSSGGFTAIRVCADITGDHHWVGMPPS